MTTEIFADFAAKIETEGWWHLRYQSLLIVCTKSPTKWLIYDMETDTYLRDIERLSLVMLEDCEDIDALLDVTLASNFDFDPDQFLVANLTEDDLRAIAPSARVLWTHPQQEPKQ
ncbi:MAG: hypothetical protein E6Q97_17575 [Desulfurellales bacterium]|nr:MAG: hypothetical protein E6Q97_17575 [Desulfurellales bacterium]